MAFYDRLKQARKAAGMTQTDIAESLGISKATYSGYENGKHEPTMRNIAIMLSVLNISADWLWQDEMSNLGHSNTDELNDDNERTLIRVYRSLNEEGQKTLLATALLFSDNRYLMDDRQLLQDTDEVICEGEIKSPSA